MIYKLLRGWGAGQGKGAGCLRAKQINHTNHFQGMRRGAYNQEGLAVFFLCGQSSPSELPSVIPALPGEARGV